ncbi:MAG TPA: hypothetical protein VGH38_23750 [Bryobacteraceae bacterium]|jgi:hypothetical protein
MANFQGFDQAQTSILMADIEAARQIAIGCTRIRPSMGTLLQEAFGIDAAAPESDQVEQIKKVYAGFPAQIAIANFQFHPGIGDPAALEFDSFPDRTQPNTILVRPSYFFKAPVDRALTLIHHSVHLRFPHNPGDGHPGGQMAMFARGSMGIAFPSASRNPCCYEYFARFLPYI